MALLLLLAVFVFLILLIALLGCWFAAEQRGEGVDCGGLLEEGAADVEAGQRGQVERGEQLEALAANETVLCVAGGVPRLSSCSCELSCC